MSMVTSLELSSKEVCSKICDSATGQIVFEDNDGKDSELASLILADNKNLEKQKNKGALSESAAPLNRVKLRLQNCYLAETKVIERLDLLEKLLVFNKTESTINHYFISWTRGRGS